MKRMIALAAVALLSCAEVPVAAPPTPRAKDEVLFLTFSPKCTDGGRTNYVAALFAGGLEEMLASSKVEKVGTGGTSTDATGSTGVKKVDTSGTQEDAVPEVYFRFVHPKTLRYDAESQTTAKTTKTTSSGTDAVGKTTETEVKRETTRTEAEQAIIAELIKRGISLDELHQSGLTLALNPLFYALILEQFTRGKFVLTGGEIMDLLQRTDMKSLASERLRNIWAVDQKVSILRITKSLVQTTDFDNLARGKSKKVYVYTIQVKNVSKSNHLIGVTLVDRLPEGLDLDREWLTAVQMKIATDGGKAGFDTIREEKATTVVWSFHEAVKPETEITLTFGVVEK